MKKKKPEYELVFGVDIECAAIGCKKRVTHYAIRTDAEDRRVWCEQHRNEAKRAGRAPGAFRKTT